MLKSLLHTFLHLNSLNMPSVVSEIRSSVPNQFLSVDRQPQIFAQVAGFGALEEHFKDSSEAMAVDLWSENSSPRISFSYDLSVSDIVPVEQRQQHRPRSSGLSSSFDFDFCPTDHDPFTADEFFSDGKILPVDIKKKPISEIEHDPTNSLIPPHSVPEQKHDSISKPGSGSGSKSFWRFKRSTSLNCGSGYGRSFCPLPLLSRSNSTGSTPNVKNSVFPKQALKNGSSQPSKPSPSSSSHRGYQKPPLRKGNGTKVNPHVLNVHSSGNLFGIGTVFFTGKEKSKRK